MTQAIEMRPRFDVTSDDIEYLPGLLACVYQPQGTGPFHALIEIHGGAWNNNDRTQNAPMVQELASHGVVVASIDFRLGRAGAYPRAMQDINFATRWLKQHAADFNAVADALGGLGLSSGGQQIMLSAMRPRDQRYCAIPLDAAPDLDASLAYVMMGWPVIDPHARYLHARSRGRTQLLESHHRWFGDEDTMREANPQQILERGERVELPPALIFQGADDDVLAPRTAERFVESYGQSGGIIELAKFPHAGHGYSRQGGPNALRTVDLLNGFVERQLKAVANNW
ncbi:MAG: alpha/beta hydrolase [Chloroflexi bacterium]|nr:MAG: alpha/beta hydrolase [Chloroflexota bacterium]